MLQDLLALRFKDSIIVRHTRTKNLHYFTPRDSGPGLHDTHKITEAPGSGVRQTVVVEFSEQSHDVTSLFVSRLPMIF